MRDRETDSWWSIMTASAVGGTLEGAPLPELPYSTKTTWREWRRKYPDTLVLQVEGQAYLEENHYDKYFSSEKTYRDIVPEDDRLAPKLPIYAFRLEGRPVAIAHHKIEGGFSFTADPTDRKAPRIFLYRTKGGSVFESTRAYKVPMRYLAFVLESAKQMLDRIESAIEAGQAEAEGIETLTGIDTYWYNWIAQNPDTRVIPQE